MSESSRPRDEDLTAGATTEGDGGTVDSATADREAAFDDPVSSASGAVTEADAVVADPPADSTVDESLPDSDPATSHDADVAAGYDE